MISLKTTITQGADMHRQIEDWRNRLPKAMDIATRREALRLAGIIRKGIRSGGFDGHPKFASLAETTKKMKKSSKPLINHGDMLRSVGSDLIGFAMYFVGVNRKARAEDGEALYNIAEIHEEGVKPFKIRVTPKMRRFWMAMTAKGIFKAPISPSKKVLHHKGIKARPFIRPGVQVWEKDTSNLWAEAAMKAMGRFVE